MISEFACSLINDDRVKMTSANVLKLIYNFSIIAFDAEIM